MIETEEDVRGGLTLKMGGIVIGYFTKEFLNLPFPKEEELLKELKEMQNGRNEGK